jgi:hypothetical protein
MIKNWKKKYKNFFKKIKNNQNQLKKNCGVVNQFEKYWYCSG